MNPTSDPSAADFYARLGIVASASASEVRTAYLVLVRQFTPERAPEQFKRIREAYETLSNSVSRRQYDSRPDPKILAWLEQASQALAKKDYQAAERAYKRVLLESPSLLWVRNLLGLCFLYQGDAEHAVAQYEKILQQPCDDAATHGNAGHAYRLAKRFEESEREFRKAMQLGGEDSAEYGLGLISLLMDEGKREEADAVAKAEGEAAPPGSVAAVDYACSRIEIALTLGKRGKVSFLVEKVSQGLADDQQRRYGAFALGKVASRLIALEAFEAAESVSLGAKALQPDDPDYDALEQASSLLHRNDFAAVTRLLNTHVSFAPNGWLRGLQSVIRQYCVAHAAFDGMVPISAPPDLGSLNGIGFTLLGKRDEDAQTGTYVATVYFTFFFLPLFPVKSYRVRPAQKGWYFLGRVKYGRAQKIHWALFLVVCAWVVLNSLAGGATESGGFGQSPIADSVVEATNSATSAGGEPTGAGSPNGAFAASAQTDSMQQQASIVGTATSARRHRGAGIHEGNRQLAHSLPAASATADSADSSRLFSESSLPTVAIYEGRATNTTAKQRPLQGSIRLTIMNWEKGPNGYLHIFPPLGGSGDTWLAARRDSVRMISVSLGGDTIAWRGKRVNGGLVGAYLVLGGESRGQKGNWYVTHSSGDTIPAWLNASYWY